jgi:hypothetical protein
MARFWRALYYYMDWDYPKEDPFEPCPKQRHQKFLVCEEIKMIARLPYAEKA